MSLPRRIAIKCCEAEAIGPEGPDGHPHDEGCTRLDIMGRMECCGNPRRRGHHRDCDMHGRAPGRWGTAEPEGAGVAS